MAQLRIVFQTIEITGTRSFESNDGIEPRLTASHPHDFQQRLFVKLVVELVFVNEEQIRNDRQLKLTVTKRQRGQTAWHVASPLLLAIIFEERPIRALPK